MSEITGTTAEPVYVTRLALKRLPFAVTPDKEQFFEDQQIQQRRVLLLHLLRSTHAPVYLSAPPGMGKTTLLLQLQQQDSPDLRFCIIDVRRFDVAMATMASTFGASQDLLEPEDALRQRLIQLRRLNIVPVVLIDDADQLSPTALAQLNHWLSWQHEQQPLLQAVLTGRAVSLAIPHLQRMDLPTLPAAQVPAYLLQRLHSAGYQDELPFTAKQIKRIARQSHGVPARINQLAHQQLLGVNVSINWREWLPENLGRTLRWLAITGLALVVLVVLFYQHDINDWINPIGDSEQTIAIPPLSESEPIAPVIVGENNVEERATVALSPQPTEEELIKRDELAELLADIPDAMPPTNSDNTVAAEQEPVESKPSAPQSDVETGSSTQLTELPQQDTEPDTVEQPVTATAKEPVAKLPSPAPTTQDNTHAVHDQAWLLAQPAKHYTFQLMGAWNDNETDAFIKKHKLSGDVARFTSLRDGKPWHVVVYGIYPTRQAALSASNQPPLKNASTWLRRLDSVQKQIKNKGVTP